MLFVVLGLAIIACAKMIASAAASVLATALYAATGLLAIGVVMMAVAVILFWVTVVMQHYDEQKTMRCERIMKMMALRGALLTTVGFLANVALQSDLMPMWIHM